MSVYWSEEIMRLKEAVTDMKKAITTRQDIDNMLSYDVNNPRNPLISEKFHVAVNHEINIALESLLQTGGGIVNNDALQMALASHSSSLDNIDSMIKSTVTKMQKDSEEKNNEIRDKNEKFDENASGS